MVWFLGQEEPLEKEMATHFSILSWEISWTKAPGGLQSMVSHKSRTWLNNNSNMMLCRESPKDSNKKKPNC